MDGRQHVRSIGRFGPLTPDQARLRARAILLNPAAPPEGDSFSVMVERYLAQRRQRLRISTLVEMERHLRKHSAALARLKLEAITRRDIAGVLAQHPGIVRNRIRGSLLAMFNWAIREGLIERNPVAGTGKLEERARERVLSEAEIRQLWHALPSGDYGRIVKLLVLTGQRREEIARLRWDEIDGDRIVLPAARTKNKREHTLLLSKQALAILGERAEGSVFNFKNWDRAKARLDRALGFAPWCLHDLRRTMATGCAELGIAPHIIEAILNHQSGHKASVAGVYNRARYIEPMRDALMRWADHVEQITRS
ncbi:MAG TPA: tyrosine-type recombinase/integrase [Xanthobacteraceae bacterium]|nr:tyrosine-type recombinase/integrase [Xanthobacteraceae bacterium]